MTAICSMGKGMTIGMDEVEVRLADGPGPREARVSEAVLRGLGMHAVDLPRQVRASMAGTTAVVSVVGRIEGEEGRRMEMTPEGLARLLAGPVAAGPPWRVHLSPLAPVRTEVDGTVWHHGEGPGVVERVVTSRDHRLALLLPGMARALERVVGPVAYELGRVGVPPTVWWLTTEGTGREQGWVEPAAIHPASYPGLDDLFFRRTAYAPTRPFRFALALETVATDWPLVVIGGGARGESKQRLYQLLASGLGAAASAVGFYLAHDPLDGRDVDLVCWPGLVELPVPRGVAPADLHNRLAPAVQGMRGGGLLVALSRGLLAEPALRTATTDALARALARMMVNPVR